MGGAAPPLNADPEALNLQITLLTIFLWCAWRSRWVYTVMLIYTSQNAQILSSKGPTPVHQPTGCYEMYDMKQLLTSMGRPPGQMDPNANLPSTTTSKRHRLAKHKTKQLPNNYPSFILIPFQKSISEARVVVRVVVVIKLEFNSFYQQLPQQLPGPGMWTYLCVL